MNIAIIVAAGSGKRFGGKTPKQFLEINGKPVLVHTLERFENCSSVDEIVLVLSGEVIDSFSTILKNYNLSKLKNIVEGGDTRAESVANGLNSVNSDLAKIIAVHDGARPLVTSEEITKTIESAEQNGAACLVAEVTDTIKEVSVGKVTKTINRTKLRRALTPQCFQYEILKNAFEQSEVGEIVTDECYLVEQMGHQIECVEGSSANIKITHKNDLKITEILLKDID